MEKAKLASQTFHSERSLIDESYISISYNTAENWLYVLWKGDRTKENLLRGSEQLLNSVVSTGTNKIINDSSNLTKPLPDVVDWFAHVYAPQLEKTGIEYFAWIYDDQNVIKPTADSILQKEKSDIIVMVFDKVQTAETWLRSVKK